MLNFTFAEHEFSADPSGALWWPAQRTLIVADLHIEKGSAFGMRGQFLPPYDSMATLERLAQVAAKYDARRILTLGDNVHDAQGWSRISGAVLAQLQQLATLHELHWLFGNHDKLQQPPVGTIALELAELGLTFGHEPRLADNIALLAGHLHPCACLPTAFGRQHRVRCFTAGERLLILPAFGHYTGGLDVADAAFAGLLDDATDLLLCGTREIHRLPFGAYMKAREKPGQQHPGERHRRIRP